MTRALIACQVVLLLVMLFWLGISIRTYINLGRAQAVTVIAGGGGGGGGAAVEVDGQCIPGRRGSDAPGPGGGKGGEGGACPSDATRDTSGFGVSPREYTVLERSAPIVILPRETTEGGGRPGGAFPEAETQSRNIPVVREGQGALVSRYGGMFILEYSIPPTE